ncbi:serine hydrolase domain-containing protein [Niabella drilacis]|uniref:CubicO group peptidase, beta-lactamase class C family n=1 Tax=Niabella drilacis (strain DSM 25811 / CCM 8410 / CCUG 62505 / LMG 26954 / E90) TaxID=1285928 RepID=A0A1G6N0N4_NIADE|nr:serine hydrolase [Niabella drilacis]SDC61392.1 CubicO group peptidase, beta-lactamase class C family [Niabella drilacis]
MKRMLTVAALFAILLTSCYILTPLRFRKMNLMDHQKMPFTKIAKSDTPFLYHRSVADPYPAVSAWLDQHLEHTYTAAFLVIKNDSILYEKYFGNYTAATLFPSFSVIKSYIGTLTGIALQEQKIKSLSDPMTRYLPEFLKKDPRFKNITIQHLLDMRSGIQWNEGSYGLNDDAVKTGFSSNIMKQALKIRIATPPTAAAEYKSINTLLLGLIISRATGQTLAQYFEEKIWKPTGTEYEATLTTDRKGLPITFAGLNATARDFARLGILYLNNGYMNYRQIISPRWIRASVSPDSLRAYGGYRNQWWSSYKGGAYLAQGILGQYIYVVPAKRLVIVRLGHFWQHPSMYAQSLLAEAAARY